MKYQPYRDEPYQRECEDRYEPIHALASSFKRPFSVLDIGANFGWFGQRLVKDFDNCTYVGIDDKTIDPHPRIWHINKHLRAETLAELSRSESFDMVLCLSVLHHFPDYEIAFNAAKRLGVWSIFEIPGEEDEHALAPERHRGIAKLFEGVTPLAEFDSHVSKTARPMYVAKTEPFLTEQSLDAAYRGAMGYASYKLVQTPEESTITIDRTPVKEAIERREFIPGMNLHNYQLLGGEGVEMPDDNHPDPFPWNYIIGDGVHPIDTFHAKPLLRLAT